MFYDINKIIKSNLLKEYYCIMKKYNMQTKNQYLILIKNTLSELKCLRLVKAKDFSRQGAPGNWGAFHCEKGS